MGKLNTLSHRSPDGSVMPVTIIRETSTNSQNSVVLRTDKSTERSCLAGPRAAFEVTMNGHPNGVRKRCTSNTPATYHKQLSTQGAPALTKDYNKNSLNEVLGGERRKIREFVEAVTPIIQARVARVFLGEGRSSSGGRIREEVADTTQEIFALLFADQGRVLRLWEPSKGLSLNNYVGLIARRHTLSMLRSKRRNPFTEMPTEDHELQSLNEGAPSAEGQVTSRDLLREVFRRTQEALSPTGMQLFELLFLQDRDVPEIISKTGMTDSAVYAWKSRLQKLLRKKYDEVLGEVDSLKRIAVAEVGR